MGMVSKAFLIYPPGCLPLVLHGLVWYLPNSQATQGGGGMNLPSFLGIIPLLDNLRRGLKVQWFSMLCQTRVSLLYHPKGSLVYHILDMSSLVIFYTNIYLSTSSKLLGSWDGLSFIFKIYSPVSRFFYWTKI